MERPVPHDEFTPKTAAALARYVSENAAGPRRPLSPVGGRTALRQGGPLPAETALVSLSDLTLIVDYPAADMTITVEAGFRVEELQQVLAAQGQRLPIDIPQAHRATIGGAIATNTSGPGRYAHGTLRDYVIGISAVDGLGRLFSSGGRVVKNVAGYDLCKLLVGSFGTLAMITQVTLKLRPLAEAKRLLWLTFENAAAIDPALEILNTSQTRPLAVEVLCPKAAWNIQREAKVELSVDRFVLAVAYEGTTAEVDWQTRMLRDEMVGRMIIDAPVVDVADVERVWSALTEHPAASDDPLTFQAGVLPSQVVEFVTRAHHADVAVQCHAGNGVVIGHLSDDCTSGAQAETVIAPLRAFAEAGGGSLVILSCDESWKPSLPPFGSPRPDWPLMRRVKAALDPHGVLSPNRLWSGDADS
ncbi:MAG: FAD-binding oxidoreductase [Planctomycetaceae bacterium]|nr:FAD-binding oxidoreductase [Planctomycetaceae bacterium]